MSKKKQPTPIPQDAPVLKKATRVKIQPDRPKVQIVDYATMQPVAQVMSKPLPALKTPAQIKAAQQRENGLRNAVPIDLDNTEYDMVAVAREHGWVLTLREARAVLRFSDQLSDLHFRGILLDKEYAAALGRLRQLVRSTLTRPKAPKG